MNLNLFTIRFPIMAIISILHRISGIILLLGIPLFIWLLQGVSGEENRFNEMKSCLTYWPSKIFIWFMLCSLFYHVFAGIRHMIMDIGYWEDLNNGRKSSIGVIIISILMSIIMGFVVW